MIRQRIYNPAHLTPHELKESFVARQDTLAEMLRVLAEQTPGRPCQHMMLIGLRGMGKTTLGLRFLHSIEENPELRNHWQPVAFHEESYGIVSLADLWTHALRHLSRATGEARWADRADALEGTENDMERLSAYSLDGLMDFTQESGKRLILFVENIDAVLGQMRDERQIHMLRGTLIERPELLLLGSANAFFQAITGYDQPLYEFFRIFRLEGVDQEDARRILKSAADCAGRSGVSQTIAREHGRLETIRRLTGGTPRLLILACRMLVESPFGSPMEDLERLIDEQTPYFKARIEDLPVQARKVFHCLSEGWKPLLAKEVAAAAKLSSSHASAQLKQLLERGYVREVELPGAKRIRYEVSDRFYNLYYLLRFSSTSRCRLERLVAFLHDLFGPAPMRAMYRAALEKSHANGVGAGGLSELLAVLAPHVAGDRGFEGREHWRNQAVELVMKQSGPNSPVIKEIKDTFAGHQQERDIGESMRHAWRLVLDGRLVDAETSWREIVAHQPLNSRAWIGLADVLLRQDRSEEALSALDRVAVHSGSDDATRLRVASFVLRSEALLAMNRHKEAVASLAAIGSIDSREAMILACKGAAVAYMSSGLRLAEEHRYEEAVAVLRHTTELASTHDEADMRAMAAEAIELEGGLLTLMNREREAIDARQRVTEYVRMEDAEAHRSVAVRALSRNGDVLCRNAKYEEAIGFWKRIAAYVRPDDPPALRHSAAATTAFAGRVLIALDELDEAESVLEMATDVDPDCEDAWAGWAHTMVLRGDARRLEAEEYARRALQLNPRNPEALHALSDVLAHGGRWTEALERLEQAVDVEAEELDAEVGPRLTGSLMRAAAAGHGQRVKRMMEDSGLAKPMEAVWHAVRAELGEELEPLPAEIMGAVMEVRRRHSSSDRSKPAAVRDG